MTIKNKMLLGALLLVTSAAWAAPATAGSTNTSGISKYELSSFIADFKHFKPGDTVPEMYRTDEYNIKQWQLRNLPAPDAGTHWTYMGGAYVLISDTDGKIIKAYDGEIFYHRLNCQTK
ncbi:RcnB family protein, partial [Escherichia coli]